MGAAGGGRCFVDSATCNPAVRPAYSGSDGAWWDYCYPTAAVLTPPPNLALITQEPTTEPTKRPTTQPTKRPTTQPTVRPTVEPTLTAPQYRLPIPTESSTTTAEPDEVVNDRNPPNPTVAASCDEATCVAALTVKTTRGRRPRALPGASES